jgi:hypothetical protein
VSNVPSCAKAKDMLLEVLRDVVAAFTSKRDASRHRHQTRRVPPMMLLLA